MNRKHPVLDHRTVVVHDIRGRASHRLHEVSVPFGDTLEGYTYSHGWRDAAGKHWAVQTKRVPLVAGDK